MTYDSGPDTLEHIKEVRKNLYQVVQDLLQRGVAHDSSKLVNPEKEVFDEYSQKLKGLTYGSVEYNECLLNMGIALDHHYAHNDHHPEHYSDGILEMNLMSIIEMLADWKAATLRMDDGDLRTSIDINAERFRISAQLHKILVNTAADLGWL